MFPPLPLSVSLFVVGEKRLLIYCNSMVAVLVMSSTTLINNSTIYYHKRLYQRIGDNMKEISNKEEIEYILTHLLISLQIGYKPMFSLYELNLLRVYVRDMCTTLEMVV